MSNLRRLTWEEAEDFISYLIRAGYRVVVDCRKQYDDISYTMSIFDMLGDVLAHKSVDYDIDFSTLILRGLDDYITTDDGKEMVALWEQ